jgi:hypothetical protein
MTDEQIEAVAIEADARYGSSTDTMVESLIKALRRHLPAPQVVAGEVLRETMTPFVGYLTPEEWEKVTANLNARLRARAGTTDTIPVRVVRRPTETVTAFRTPREEGVRDEVHVCVEYTSGKFSMQTAVALSEYLTNGLRRDVVRWCVPGQPWHESAVTQTPRAWAADDCEAMVGRRVLMLDRTGNYAAFIHPEDDAADYVDYAVQFNAAECYILPPTEAA